MKRFHVNVSVPNLSEGIRFYTALFASPPSVQKSDYAKWMMEDPRINFAISQRGGAPGVNHIGFQLDTAEELVAMRGQLHAADRSLLEQSDAACCYALSNKYWVTDPSGVAWETFHTLDAIPIYGEDTDITSEERSSACATAEPAPVSCCIPEPERGSCCAV